MTANRTVDWMLIATALGAVAAWMPTVLSFCHPLSIQGKVISQYASICNFQNGGTHPIFVQKVSVFSKNKDFYLKDLEVYLKYPNTREEKCTVWTWRNLEFVFTEEGKPVKRKLNINASDYLNLHSVFPHDQAVVGYVSFASSNVTNDAYEYVRYVFVDFSGNKKELTIEHRDINDNSTVFDDNIWLRI